MHEVKPYELITCFPFFFRNEPSPSPPRLVSSGYRDKFLNWRIASTRNLLPSTRFGMRPDARDGILSGLKLNFVHFSARKELQRHSDFTSLRNSLHSSQEVPVTSRVSYPLKQFQFRLSQAACFRLLQRQIFEQPMKRGLGQGVQKVQGVAIY